MVIKMETIIWEYFIEDNEITITGGKFDKTTLDKTVLPIPEELEGFPVTVIGKKAFLGRRDIKRVALPASIKRVEDWAFAHTVSLEKVMVESRNVTFGKEVFLGCNCLKLLSFGEEEKGMLLAAMLRQGKAGSLLDSRKVRTPQWYKDFDEKLENFLFSEDKEGYEGLWTFGEEDYSDYKFDCDNFCEERRLEKVELLYLRLLYREELPLEKKQVYEAYLKGHTLGEETEEAFLYLQREAPKEIHYFKILKEAGGIHGKNRLLMLEKLENSSAEVRAFLMNTDRLQNDFFAGLNL